MEIASPWDHRVYEKKGEKIEKYQDLKKKKPALLGTARILRKVLERWRRRNDPRDLWPLAMAHYLGVMSV